MTLGINSEMQRKKVPGLCSYELLNKVHQPLEGNLDSCLSVLTPTSNYLIMGIALVSETNNWGRVYGVCFSGTKRRGSLRNRLL
mmetsp:Transcript_100542/g.162100  ORF Transcript_100542/g.162100 Transcript_100542/m.162100 type:complete len:84 (+) Transcript_100542:618-869(+)